MTQPEGLGLLGELWGQCIGLLGWEVVGVATNK